MVEPSAASSTRRTIMKLASRIFGAALLTSVTIAPALAVEPFTVVLDGLQSPRGLSFGPGGRLYVGQSGNGVTSGKTTELRSAWETNPNTKDLVTGLPSIGDGGGGFAGPNGISVIGNGTIYAIMGTIYTDPPTPPGLQGHLLKASQGGQVRDVANVADFDFAWFRAHPELGFDGDHMVDGSDANPYGILALPNALYVVDAATNTLDLVRPNGAIEVLAYFPDNALADSTPTCIAQGPDGSLYVVTLALSDSLVLGPSAIVYRVVPTAADPSDFNKVLHVATPWATGLWPINGCTFGPDGSFYASELITHDDFSGGSGVTKPFPAARDQYPPAERSLTYPTRAVLAPGAAADAR